MSDTQSETWLSLDDAAKRFGVSRMRMREAIAAGLIAARRDNRGFWQVSPGADLAGLRTRMEANRLAPEDLVELLFDEIEEVSLLLADRDANLERMNAIAARQQELIARALSMAEASVSPDQPAERDRLAGVNDRSLRLIETALEKLAARDADISRLTGLLDRSLTAIAGLEAEVTRQAGVAERQKGLIEKLFSVAEASLERFAKSEARGRGLLERMRDRLVGGRGGGIRG